MRKPFAVLIKPNSTVYQYKRVRLASDSIPNSAARTPPAP